MIFAKSDAVINPCNIPFLFIKGNFSILYLERISIASSDFIENGAAVKVYRGLASRDSSINRNALEKNVERQERAPEGVSTRVPYRGEVKKILQNLIDGLQSGMSYSGAKNIKEFWQKAKFIRMTEAGMKESLPRL